jgi:L-tyrosine isonitrile synthase
MGIYPSSWFVAYVFGGVLVQLRDFCDTVNERDFHCADLADRKKVSIEVLQSFNTWAFKRQQPTEPAELLRFTDWSIGRALPIRFVLYWGKGPRVKFGEPDFTCLKFLSQMGDRIRSVYAPGAHFTLIATDTHAAHNGHSHDDIANYFSGVFEAASEFGYSYAYLSSILTSQQYRMSEQVSSPSADFLRKLEPCAAKWYRGEGASLQGAARYYHMNMLEKQAVGLEFPRSIFITFNNAEFRELFPDMLPVFYMYSLRKGISVKPWFIDNVGDCELAYRHNQVGTVAAAI